jgi:hypothetical protein
MGMAICGGLTYDSFQASIELGWEKGMSQNDFKFIPLRGMSWDDLSKWVLQSSPEHFEFVNSVSGALYSLFRGSLPDARFDDGIVAFSWSERDRLFSLKMKVCSANKKEVDVEWQVRDQEGIVLEEGFVNNSYWLPTNLVRDFSFHWSVANEYHLLALRLGMAIFIIAALFAGLLIVS